MRERLREVFRKILAPFSISVDLLKRGHINYLIYISVLLAGLWYGGSALEERLHLYVGIIEKEQRLAHATAERLLLIVSILTWSLGIPLIVTALALPVRFLILHGHTPLFHLAKATPTALRLAVQSTMSAFYWIFFYSIPLAGLFMAYVGFGERSSSIVVRDLFIVAALAVGTAVLFKLVPLVCAPIISVAAGYEARFTLFHCESILRPQRLAILGIMLGTALLAYFWDMEEFDPSVSLACAGFTAWLSLTIITGKVVRAAVDFEKTSGLFSS